MLKKLSYVGVAFFTFCLAITIVLGAARWNHNPFTITKRGDIKTVSADKTGTVTVKAQINDINGSANLGFILSYDGFLGEKYVGRSDFDISTASTRYAQWNNMKKHFYHGKIVVNTNPSGNPISGQLYISSDN